MQLIFLYLAWIVVINIFKDILHIIWIFIVSLRTFYGVQDQFFHIFWWDIDIFALFGSWTYIIFQGCSSTKIVGGPMSWKNVGHHSWLTEKVLCFEWPKTAQMALEFLYFLWNIFRYVQDFLVRQNMFVNLFLFTKVFFHKNPENFPVPIGNM